MLPILSRFRVGVFFFFATTVKNARSLSVVERHANTTGSALVTRANKSAGRGRRAMWE